MKPKSIITALALLGLSAMSAPMAWAQEQTATAIYKMVVHIGPPETMLMPGQAMPGMTGEVVVPMPGMPMPEMALGQGNHHLEVHLYDKSSGAVVTDVLPAISWQNQATGQSGTVSPVMAMYGIQEGKSDWHYGGNVMLADGTYTVTVTMGGDRAVFKDVAVGGTLAQACVQPGGGGGCFASIQDAVDAAASGATVTVAAGSYTAGAAKQVVLIQKALTLQGADATSTIIDAAGADHGIVVQQADAVTISGFTIQNANLQGALLDRSSHVTLKGNVLRKNDSNPGTTLSGTLANDTGGATDDYSVIGDGNTYTVTATLTGIDPNFPAAGVIVYGPSGQAGQGTLRGGIATFPLTTTKGTVYTVQVNSYQPRSQAAYSLTFAASS